MSTELKTSELVAILEGDDLWVRGRAYVQFKYALEEAEMELEELEQRVARARYEHEIAQRIHAKTTDKQARKDWERRVKAAHDALVTEERRLAEVTERADYCCAMLAEIEADLGEKAGQYEEILGAVEWAEEDWEEFEDWDEFDEFEGWDEFDEWDEEDEWEDEDLQPGEGSLQ
jgi:hypothetical protein